MHELWIVSREKCVCLWAMSVSYNMGTTAWLLPTKLNRFVFFFSCVELNAQISMILYCQKPCDSFHVKVYAPRIACFLRHTTEFVICCKIKWDLLQKGKILRTLFASSWFTTFCLFEMFLLQEIAECRRIRIFASSKTYFITQFKQKLMLI